MTDTIKATKSQRHASAPEVSAWVSASAGSGKTLVLVYRVVRLLLEGAPPDRILCITYTNAAAAQMANRLFEILAQWVFLDDDGLARAIEAVTGRRPGGRALTRARTLFARALETPGGLKIQTIHAFCESVLHRFPLEAGLVTDFDVLDERGAEDLLHEARLAVLAMAGTGADPDLQDALGTIPRYLDDQRFGELLKSALNHREALDAAGAHDMSGWSARLAAFLGLEPRMRPEQIMEQAVGEEHFPATRLRGWMDILLSGSKRAKNCAARIEAALEAGASFARYDAYLSIFLKDKLFGRDRRPYTVDFLMTKPLREEFPEFLDWALEEQQRAWRSYDAFKAAHVVEASSALWRLANGIFSIYGARKMARAMLDYEDLIDRTVHLLARSDAAWVLYKLDHGIDHILIDEAQDTSPAQWSIVRSLAEEFFAGKGARDQCRTLFAVGDEKQSIYSFQGADPASFARMRRYFNTKVEQARQTFRSVPLTLSYRSAPAVLQVVDAVFCDQTAAGGLVAEGLPDPHQASREDAFGRVELWPLIESEEENAPGTGDAPLDRRAPAGAQRLLAEKISEKIAELIAIRRPDRVSPGEILILVRRRSAFVHDMMRALKSRNIPVAGADRMKLSEQIEVMDLMALGRFVLLPDDDLTLAELLKSPLMGWDDDQLFALAHGRSGSLWNALQSADAGHEADARDRLRHWLGMADQVPPFEFYSRILGTEGMRLQLLARLGVQANDAIDEFLSLALDYETRQTPSLQGFLNWIVASEVEVKRDMEHGRHQVRIMTVHGAKGLEADVVFLPDTCSAVAGGKSSPIYPVDVSANPSDELVLPVWAIGKGYVPDALRPAVDEADRLREEEYHRLLYVAMTRARDRLYICGYKGKHKIPGGCWYELAQRAMENQGREIRDETGATLCWRVDAGSRPEAGGKPLPDRDAGAPATLPDWLARAAPREAPPGPVIAPSRLATAEETQDAGTPGDPPVLSPLAGRNDRRFQRGRLIHRLLQVLPEAEPREREALALSYLAQPAHGLDPESRTQIAADVLTILEDDRFSGLFAPGSLAEVPLMASIETGQGGATISGQVDRLVVSAQEVMVIDYKTNRPAPERIEDIPALYCRQMAAYARALRKIYPGRRVRGILLWTDGPRMMELPARLLDPGAGGA